MILQSNLLNIWLKYLSVIAHYVWGEDFIKSCRLIILKVLIESFLGLAILDLWQFLKFMPDYINTALEPPQLIITEAFLVWI